MSCNKRIRVWAAALLGAALWQGGPPDAGAATIRLAMPADRAQEDHDGALVFQHFVERRSGGEVSVEIYPDGGVCADGAGCLERLRSGEVEVTVSGTDALALLFAPGSVLDLPYLFRDDRVAACVLDGSFASDLRGAVLGQAPEARLMAIANAGGWRNFATTGRPVRRPEDVQGMTIRTDPEESQIELIRMLGGSPVPLPWSEVGPGLAAGAIDGAKNDMGAITAMRLEDHLEHVTLDGHTYLAAFWWINDDFFMGLPAAHRTIVHDGFEHLKLVARALPMRRAVDAQRTFEAAGGEVHVPSAEEKQAFADATAGMKDWFKSRHGDTWLIKLEKAIADCEAQIEAEHAAFAEE